MGAVVRVGVGWLAAPAGGRRRGPRWAVLLGSAVIVAAVAGVYYNSLEGQFVIDDHDQIVGNVRIRQLWPSWPKGHRWPVWLIFNSPRPVVLFTLAVNYRLGGLEVRGYHLFNIAVHVVAALALYGIVRRTLGRARWRRHLDAAALPLALAVGLIWAVHPLHTGAVTYVIQRAESMMGMFYLLAVYCMVRGVSSRRAWPWLAGSVACCVFGVGCKEVMVTAPLVMLAYDRLFVSGSFRALWRRRRWFYLALGGTWVLLGVRLWLRPGGTSAGFRSLVGPWWEGPVEYALTQFGVIVHYLKLSVWPTSLCIDYWWLPAKTRPFAVLFDEVLKPAGLIVVLLAATAAGLVRRSGWGFLGLWFFLILAPSSSIMPIKDRAFEHRMYLSLAAVVSAGVLCAYWLGRAGVRRLGGGGRLGRLVVVGVGCLAVVAVAGTLGYLTVQRNAVYLDDRLLYQDIVNKAPHNPRGYRNLGVAMVRAGQLREALPHLRKSIDLKWDSHEAHNNFGAAKERLGDLKTAIREYRIAIQISPYYRAAYNNLGAALGKTKQYRAALSCFQRAARLAPWDPDPYMGIGTILAETGRKAEAMRYFQMALARDPRLGKAYYNMGVVFIDRGELEQAAGCFARAVRYAPHDSSARFNLGMCLWMMGRPGQALGQFRSVLRLRPGDAVALNATARLLATYPDGRFRNGPEAVRLAEAVCKAVGYSNHSFLATLAAAYAEVGRFQDAVRTIRLAAQLARQAGSRATAAQYELHMALFRAGRPLRKIPTPRGRSRPGRAVGRRP